MNMNNKFNFSILASAVLRILILTALVGLAFLKLSPVRAAGTIYDNTDAGWTYTGTWTASTGVAGAYNNTFKYTGTTGDKATFTFSGTQFVLIYTQNTNRGNIEVRVDGNLVTTINANGALLFQKTYTSPFYANGTHTVEFKNAGGPGIYIDIDAIQIQ